MNAADLVLAGGRAEAPALVGEEGTLSRAALRAMAGRYGNGLARARAGRGARVILVLDDRPALFAAFLGAMRIGAVPVVVNPRLRADELGRLIEDSGAALVLAEPDRADTVRAAGGRVVVAADDLFDGEPEGLASAEMAADDPAFWVYTSGSTGMPKGAVHRHRAARIAECTMGAVYGVGAGDRVLATSKMFFAYALGHALGALKLGAAVVLHRPWPKAEEILERARRTRPTVLYSVPSLYRKMLAAGGEVDRALASVRRFVSAGERLPPSLLERWREATGAPIAEGIGTSETMFLFLANPPAAVRPGSAGVPTPGSRLRIQGEGDRPIEAPGETGVLWVRMDSLASGYWNRPEATAAAFRDGWFRTGDEFRFDSEGYWFHEGRSDDMLKVAGQWVNPAEVEDCVLAARLCGEAALVGAADADGLAHTVLFVADVAPERAAGLEAALRDHLARRLARHKCPRQVLILDTLPRTATGKVQRYRLREMAGETERS
jgi:benzoate-CoA ligase